jgi:N4-gp56 family major capsid protein|tara:strand:- start:288 stop:1214 length:927 start_codon:yes stop_codon:yes gene_type:complete
MALGTNNTTAAIAGNFIPELWSDEVVGAYKSNLVVANLVTKLSHKGKKGDTIYIPVPERGSASVKAAGNQVTLSAATNDKVTVSINKHYEYSKLIEDIAEVQALASFRKFYTDDAGYALAKQVDSDLFTLAETFAKTGVGVVGGTGTAMYEKAVIGSNGTTLYTGNSSNASAISDAGIRGMILQLDDADVPMDNRVMVIPPVASSTMLGLNRFTEQQFIGNGDAIKTGKIGMIYGMDIFVSTNCPTATSTDRVGMMMHKDALVLAEQVGVRSQTSYKQEYLADLFTSDTIYGYQTLRHDAGVAFVVPA